MSRRKLVTRASCSSSLPAGGGRLRDSAGIRIAATYAAGFKRDYGSVRGLRGRRTDGGSRRTHRPFAISELPWLADCTRRD
jgi:hypothetical protein